MTNSVVHIFFETNMNWSHASLWGILASHAKHEELERGSFALFINPAWTGVKLLARGNCILYHRSPNGSPISVESIRRLACSMGGARLTFSKNLEAVLIKAHKERFGDSEIKLQFA